MLFSGFGQISNVEFYRTGQYGYKGDSDPRFSLVFQDVTSNKEMTRYSYVRKSSFHSSFNIAIGVFKVDGLEVDNNVVYESVSSGILTESQRTKITNNLVALTLRDSVYSPNQDLDESYPGSIHAVQGTDVVLINNTVAGSERLGYRLKGQSCDTSDTKLWSGNVATGAIIGKFVFKCGKCLFLL